MGEALFLRRDVELVGAHINTALLAVQNLNTLKAGRELSIAVTRLEEAAMWVAKLAAKTPESL
jgi:hypothetical protein